MISVEECCHLLTLDLVSEFYVPESYLSVPELYDLLRAYNWMVFASEVPGWVCVRRRMIYQD